MIVGVILCACIPLFKRKCITNVRSRRKKENMVLSFICSLVYHCGLRLFSWSMTVLNSTFTLQVLVRITMPSTPYTNSSRPNKSTPKPCWRARCCTGGTNSTGHPCVREAGRECSCMECRAAELLPFFTCWLSWPRVWASSTCKNIVIWWCIRD